jgi:hypothetical protein
MPGFWVGKKYDNFIQVFNRVVFTVEMFLQSKDRSDKKTVTSYSVNFDY